MSDGEIIAFVLLFLLCALLFASCDSKLDPITRQIITEREAAPW